MSPFSFSAACLVHSIQELYETRTETADFRIVYQDGTDIPCHSFILSARYMLYVISVY